MTQSINKPFKANEAAKQVEQLRKSFDAPAVKTVKQGLVPAPKAAKTSPVKKAGRIVGISKDENVFLETLLLDIAQDEGYNEYIKDRQAAYDKLVARYNK